MQGLSSVANQFSELVLEIDPAKTSWESLRERAHERCAELIAEVDRVREQLTRERLEESIRAKLHELLESTKRNLTELSCSLSDASAADLQQRLFTRLTKNYDQLVAQLESLSVTGDKPLRRLSTVNYGRNIFHITSGLTGALLYHFVLSRTAAIWIMGGLVALCTTLEILRRRWPALNDALMRFVFRSIARPHEYHRVNSATLYCYGLLISLLFFPQVAVESACIVLAVADPAASNLGRRFGKTKLHKDKSVVGTSAFFIVGFLALTLYLALLWPSFGMETTLLLAGGAALVGAVTELFSARFDDNLSVALAVGATATLLL